MKITRQRIYMALAALLLIWALHSRLSYYPQVSADWRTTASDSDGKGFYVAVGRLWAQQDIPFNKRSTEWVPLFLVISDFEVKNAQMMEGGGSGVSDVGFWFKDQWIKVPVDTDVPPYSAPSEPSDPNVFILHADNSIEVTDLIVRTQEQLDAIPYELRGKQSFPEIQDYLKSRLEDK